LWSSQHFPIWSILDWNQGCCCLICSIRAIILLLFLFLFFGSFFFLRALDSSCKKKSQFL
jgi:hypothetical protein